MNTSATGDELKEPTHSQRLIFWTPTFFALLIGAWDIFVQSPQPVFNSQTISKFIIIQLSGIWLSLMMEAIWKQIKFSNQEREKIMQDAFKKITEHLDPETSLKLIMEENNRIKPLIKILANEQLWLNLGRSNLKVAGKWRISTARLYEAITYSIEDADNVKIVDQDFRRWIEALHKDTQPSQPNTSTTFNYSRDILKRTYRAVESKKLKSLKRIIVIHPDINCLNGDDLQIIANPEENLSGLNEATQILLLIWAFEKALVNEIEHASSTDFQTKILQVGKNARANDLDKIRNHKDTVILEDDFCFLEEINYETQMKPINSQSTESFLCINDIVKSKAEEFEYLWDKAKGADQFAPFLPSLENNAINYLINQCK